MRIDVSEYNFFGFGIYWGEFDDLQESYIAIVIPLFSIRIGRDY